MAKNGRMNQHPWIGKRVQPVDPEHLWRRDRQKEITVKDVVESIQDSGSSVVILAVSGFSTEVRQPIDDFELVN
jgi:hypothetical protein